MRAFWLCIGLSLLVAVSATVNLLTTRLPH